MLWLGRIIRVLMYVAALLLAAWSAAALYFDLPVASLRAPAAIVYLIVVLGALLVLRRRHLGLIVAFAGFGLVVLWWFSLEPSGKRDWRPDNAVQAYADINGDEVTIHGVRNCDYVTEQDYTCRWETRSFNLSHLRGADLFITWWGSPWIAHPIVSFDFGEQGHLPMSIETRSVIGQSYSAVRGFFRQYELVYLASDERDIVRLRTNFRKDEEVYLFRIAVPPELAGKILLGYLARFNQLHQRPEWYNALTNNCTTNIDVSASQAQGRRTSFDWRVLLNGKMDEMLYQHDRLVTGGLSLPALKEQAHINAVGKADDDRPDWSELIRAGRVGFAGPSAVTTPQH